jgi:integral membrane sensor domain MASE1
MAVLYAAGVQAYSGIASAWLVYWLGDSTGVLLITPLALAVPALALRRAQDRVGEFAAFGLVLTLACLIIFGDLSVIPIRLHVPAFAAWPSSCGRRYGPASSASHCRRCPWP